MQLQWRIATPPPETIAKLVASLRCSRIIATLLANRGITNDEQARAFMHPSLQDLRPPEGLQDVDKAVQRLHRAITTNEKILIFGDYDVDGVTATAVLYEFLKAAGANVRCYIPHRLTEGYSLQAQHITAYAVPQKIDLIITADCGSASHAAIDVARQAAIDVIVTDHHEMPDPLPQALAVINPKRPDCPSGMGSLAGVGVAFYLLVALRRYLREADHWVDRPEPNLKAMCDLVTLGTIADMVPLQAENRIIAHHGLETIRNGHRPGLEALIRISGVEKKTVDADALAFYLAPRINAAGRMDHADLALALLLSDSPDAAMPLARRLQQLNTARQHAEKGILEDIQAHLAAHPRLLENKSLVLAQEGWHAGILGIVASRVAKRFHRPVVLISTDGNMGQGSARSIAGLNLYSALKDCRQSLIAFGGHAMAAGLRIQTVQIPDFQQALETTIQAMSVDTDLTPDLAIDCELDLGNVDRPLIDAIQALQPFGVALPKPLFMARNVRVCSSKIVGSGHRRMVLSPSALSRNIRLDAIQFNVGQDKAPPKRFARIAFELQWNRWNGNQKAQLVVVAVDPAT